MVVLVVAGAVVLVAVVVMGHIMQVMGAEMQGQRVPSSEEEKGGKKRDASEPADPERTSHAIRVSSPSASLKEILRGAGAATLDRAAIHADFNLSVIIAIHSVIDSHTPGTVDPA